MKIKVFARTMNHDKILKDITTEVEDFDEDNFFDIVSEICESMDLSTPVILPKHYEQMRKFNHTIFLSNEFVEEVEFKRFIVERIDDAENNKERIHNDKYAYLDID